MKKLKLILSIIFLFLSCNKNINYIINYPKMNYSSIINQFGLVNDISKVQQGRFYISVVICYHTNNNQHNINRNYDKQKYTNHNMIKSLCCGILHEFNECSNIALIKPIDIVPTLLSLPAEQIVYYSNKDRFDYDYGQILIMLYKDNYEIIFTDKEYVNNGEYFDLNTFETYFQYMGSPYRDTYTFSYATNNKLVAIKCQYPTMASPKFIYAIEKWKHNNIISYSEYSNFATIEDNVYLNNYDIYSHNQYMSIHIYYSTTESYSNLLNTIEPICFNYSIIEMFFNDE